MQPIRNKGIKEVLIVKKKWWWVFSLVIILILGIGGGYYMNKNQERNEQQQLLNAEKKLPYLLFKIMILFLKLTLEKLHIPKIQVVGLSM